MGLVAPSGSVTDPDQDLLRSTKEKIDIGVETGAS